MGCACSTEADNKEHPLQELAPRPIPGAAPPPEAALDKKELQQALSWMAEYIKKHGRTEITIIATGGVVNTISLSSRTTTHDVDWFNSNLTRDQAALLHKAARYASDCSKGQGWALPNDWFNNKTMLFIQPNLRQQLVQAAYRQNYEVFRAPGLRILAAPWSYAFISKLDRIAGGGGKAYDAKDAAIYLHMHLRMKSVESISVETVHAIAHKYQRLNSIASNTGLKAVNGAYRERYGKSAITS